ncbi:MerR family transcriptional regulator [Nocardiopsis sp. NPDC058631]|uniref:MerR family transcriptional regulator n=1 Tax=Nocardiopsis sp. NPDC058631 TaxID=3346566 RepID=UPI00365EB608
MLTIGSFSELTGFPPKTLRHYHAQGLLVPAHVDEDSQFRHYTIEQLERAGQILALRRAGLSLERIRELVDDLPRAPEGLRRYADELRRQREAQDRALEEAAAALAADSTVRVRELAAATAVVSDIPLGPGAEYDIEAENADVADTEARLGRVVAERGWTRDGMPWRSLSNVAGELMTRVSVPIAAPGPGTDAPLPEGVEVVEYEPGTEVYVLVPKPKRLGSATIGLSHLLRASGEDSYPDIGTFREFDHGLWTEFAARLLPLPPEEPEPEG